MKNIREILAKKGAQIYSVSPDDTVYHALEMMADHEIGALAVLNGGTLVGIISERDYARKVILKGASSLNTPVKTIMTSKVAYVHPEQTVDECMAIVTEKRCRHLPVLDGDKLIGLVSIGDLVKATIAEKDFLIEQMENYILGG